MNDWLTYLVVVVLVFFVVSGAQLFLKAFRSKEVTFKTPFVDAKFEPDPDAPPLESKFSPVIVNLTLTLILSFIILASINTFFPRPAPANTNTPQPSLVSTLTAAPPQPTTRISTTSPSNILTQTVTQSSAINTQRPALTPTLGIGPTQVSKADGMVQVYVPAGAFTMGSDSGESDEKPAHVVTLNAFWIDKTEVTNAMYALCVKVGACSVQETRSSTRVSYYGNTSYNNYPVINVSWNDAQKYCIWAGRRLPTEAEWEKAARGTDGRSYPWGNSVPDITKLNYASLNQAVNVGDTSEVGKYPDGASPYGALDMAGNVWEWVNDWYDEKYYGSSSANNPTGPTSGQSRALRGGSWFVIDIFVRVSFRLGVEPTGINYSIGFRCASSP